MRVRCGTGDRLGGAGCGLDAGELFGGRKEAAEGRECCGLPDLGAPVSGEEDSPGICVCALEECFEMGQSRVSYHMRKLKEAGLVREERRGRWSFYSLEREAARDLLADTGKHLSV